MLAMACAKHYAVHSGPEAQRHRFDAEPSERDLYETYLPQFEMAVREGHVGGVMGAYNAVYGVPGCASSFLLTDLLRKQWGFEGYVVSDCGAIGDIWGAQEHHYVEHARGGRCRRGQGRLQSLLRRRLQRLGAGGSKRVGHGKGN